MKLSITSLELKNPFAFFTLSFYSMRIIGQLKKSKCVTFKTTGFWTKHYTQSLWNNEEEMKNFMRSGAHLECMKKASVFAKEIRILTIDASELINWKEAKNKLKTDAKVYSY
jgi:hypothetical protein